MIGSAGKGFVVGDLNIYLGSLSTVSELRGRTLVAGNTWVPLRWGLHAPMCRYGRDLAGRRG